MLTITIQDTNTERYTYTASASVLGRRYDNIAEYITVTKPESETGRDCVMIVTYGDTVVDHIPVGDTPIAITSNLSQYASVKIGFAFLGTDGYIKNSEVKQFYFLTAQKPDGFVPLPPEQKTTVEYLLSHGFTGAKLENNILSFTNAAGEVITSVEVQAGAKNLLKGDVTVGDFDIVDVKGSNVGYPLGIEVGKKYNVTATVNGEEYTVTGDGVDMEGVTLLANASSPELFIEIGNLRFIGYDKASYTEGNDAPLPDDNNSLLMVMGDGYKTATIIVKSIIEIEEVVADKLNNALTLVVGGQEYVFDGTKPMRIEL